MLYTVEKYFLLFFIYAVVGWCIEVTGELISKHRFVNRGFLIGPYCPIYGFGAALITLLLKRYLNDPAALFVMAVVVCSVLEYLTSFFMEKLFHARWWDYSKDKFNINGRICLRTMIPFGLLGLLMMYVLNPFLLGVLEKLPSAALTVISIIVFATYITDNVISFNIVKNVKVAGLPFTDNTEEITEKVKQILRKKSVLNRRLVNAFPKMKLKLKKKLDSTKSKPDKTE